jgi:hypothetical protein
MVVRRFIYYTEKYKRLAGGREGSQFFFRNEESMTHLFNSSSNKSPLICFSNSQERAGLIRQNTSATATVGLARKTKVFDSMPPRRRRTARGHSRVKRTKGVRLVKGRVALRVAGHKGLAKFSCSQLVRFVPLKNLKSAAHKVLRSLGRTHRKKRGKRTSKKRRKGRRRRRRRRAI